MKKHRRIMQILEQIRRNARWGRGGGSPWASKAYQSNAVMRNFVHRTQPDAYAGANQVVARRFPASKTDLGQQRTTFLFEISVWRAQPVSMGSNSYERGHFNTSDLGAKRLGGDHNEGSLAKHVVLY